MFDPQRLQNDLCARLRRVLPTRPDDGLLSVTLPTPDLTLRFLPPLPPPYFYWGRPQHEQYLLGLGLVETLDADDPARFEALDRKFSRTLRSWRRVDPEHSGFGPRAFAGFAFDGEDPMAGPWRGFPNAALFLPALLLHCEGNACALTFTVRVTGAYTPEGALAEWVRLLERLLLALMLPPDPSGTRTALTRVLSDPEDAQWLRLIRRATIDIGAGHLQKVVPARRIRVCAERRLEPARLLSALGYMYPCCYLLAVDLGRGPVLASATPERLISVADGAVASDAIGGTIRRAPNQRHDDELGKALLASSKARHEHALVVEHIREALAPQCDDLDIADEPRLIKLRNLQHLWTPLRGRRADGASLLRLAARLHPTPAVGGMPVAPARRWLATHGEGTARGWYTGTVGWLDTQGDGELAVLLRCTLLDEDCADLYAGAGVVGDSDPGAELEETELKLGAMLEALENA